MGCTPAGKRRYLAQSARQLAGAASSMTTPRLRVTGTSASLRLALPAVPNRVSD
jgi:hypothetical protein